MSRFTLESASGNSVIIQEGESATLTGTFYDTEDTTLSKSAFTGLTMTLVTCEGGIIINSQLNTPILDLNNGSVAVDGTLTLKLEEEDNIIVDSTAEDGDFETHLLRLKWTWLDGDGDSRTGIQEMTFPVEKLLTPVAPA